MEPGTFVSRSLCLSMISYNCIVWNVCGLNGHARRNVVRDRANTKFFNHMVEGDVVLDNEEDVMKRWMRKRKLVVKSVRKGFHSLFFLVSWRLWKERNSRTFDGVSTDVAGLACSILSKGEEWCLAGYKHLLSLLTLM